MVLQCGPARWIHFKDEYIMDPRYQKLIKSSNEFSKSLILMTVKIVMQFQKLTVMTSLSAYNPRAQASMPQT